VRRRGSYAAERKINERNGDREETIKEYKTRALFLQERLPCLALDKVAAVLLVTR
jgi:hypothetical protein